jgi:cell wall-associated NlpC family hydrolase
MKELFLAILMSHIGVPYKWGGNNRLEGFDCSGFVQEGLMSIGLDPRGDQTAQGLFEILSQIHNVKFINEPLRGDILFFGKDAESITHTAVAINSVLMIEAGGGGRNTTTIEDAKAHSAMVRVRPIRKDLVRIVELF